MTSISMLYMLPLAMFLLMIATKSYKKSISNAATIIGLLLYGYIAQYSAVNAFYVLIFVVFIMQIRAIVNHNEDAFLKR